MALRKARDEWAHVDGITDGLVAAGVDEITQHVLRMLNAPTLCIIVA